MPRLTAPTGVTCPKCEKGELLEKKNRKGRTFYGCARYPDCDFLVGRKPLKTPCPECGELLTSSGRNRVSCTKCEHRGPVPDAEGTQGEGDETADSAERETATA